MIDKTQKYRNNYSSGFDCRLATFRNNLAYYDICITNAMALGLSGNLVFRYSPPQLNKIGIPMIVGVVNQSLESLSYLFSSYILFKKCAFEDDFCSEIRKVLNMGYVVNILINRPYLFHIRFKSDEEYKVEAYNIGHHYVTITDIDEFNNVVVFETNERIPFKLNSKQLKEIWFFDRFYKRKIVDMFHECDGYYYYCAQPKIFAHKDKYIIMCSIHMVVELFFQDKNEYAGLKGLQTFYSEISEWKNHPEIKKSLNHAMLVMKVNETLMTGGGYGRRLYGYFLSEVSVILEDKRLKTIAYQFSDTAVLWKEFIYEITKGLDFTNSDIIDLDKIDVAIHHYMPLIIDAERNEMESLKEWYESIQII